MIENTPLFALYWMRLMIRSQCEFVTWDLHDQENRLGRGVLVPFGVYFWICRGNVGLSYNANRTLKLGGGL